MVTVKWLMVIAVGIQALASPLSIHHTEEREKVSRCIRDIKEILEDSLSPSGAHHFSHCLQILKEEISQHKDEEDMDSIEEDERRKRMKETSAPSPKRGAETKRGLESDVSRENQETKEYEKVEVKEEAHKTFEEEKKKHMLEEDERKRNAPEKRGENKHKKNGKDVQASNRKEKKHFSEEDDSSEEDGEDETYQGDSQGWYHENQNEWERRKKNSGKRMAEDASEEETAHFGPEGKGVKYSKTHMQGFYGDGRGHMHHLEGVEVEREKSHHHPGELKIVKEIHFHNNIEGNHEQKEDEEEDRELEEIEEKEEHKAEHREQDLQKVEEELRRAAEKLQELHHS